MLLARQYLNEQYYSTHVHANTSELLSVSTALCYQNLFLLADAWTGSSYTESACREQFKPSLEENLNIVKKYPKGIADQFLWKIGGNMTSSVLMAQFPVIVTALNSMFYPVSMGLFYSIHRLVMTQYGAKVKVVVYDLGLTRRQLRLV